VRRVPPVMAVVLTAIWLLLNNTVALRFAILGALLSIALLAAAARLRPLQPRMRRASVAIRLIFTVLVDIVRSNIGVGRVILGLVHSHQVRSAFIEVPLDLRDPHGLAALAMIITCTPGTIWANLTADRRLLTVHVLDLIDEARWVSTIKQRYERPLMEVFE
jgi:multicomponent K+:H+ antiporter subunit E